MYGRQVYTAALLSHQVIARLRRSILYRLAAGHDDWEDIMEGAGCSPVVTVQ